MHAVGIAHTLEERMHCPVEVRGSATWIERESASKNIKTRNGDVEICGRQKIRGKFWLEVGGTERRD